MADIAFYPGLRAWVTEQKARAKRSDSVRAAVPKAIGAVRYLSPGMVRAECDEIPATLQQVEGGFIDSFMTAPSPGSILTVLLNEHYHTKGAYLQALGQALRVEHEATHQAAFLLQIDAPDLALERHVSYQDRPLSDFLEFAERVVATINDALVTAHDDRVRIHACWGNYKTPHDCDVDVHEILPTISKARVADRLERVIPVVGDPARVMAGTDCGFDSSAGRGRVAEDVVWSKLHAMAEGVQIVSRRLGITG